MPLPIIDYFANGPQTINTNFKEDFSKGRLDWIPADPHTIKDYYELAELAISSREPVGRFVGEALNSSGLMQWLGAMPSQIPKALQAYQHKNKQHAHQQSLVRVDSCMESNKAEWCGCMAVWRRNKQDSLKPDCRNDL